MHSRVNKGNSYARLKTVIPINFSVIFSQLSYQTPPTTKHVLPLVIGCQKLNNLL
jgi:hypothetical protein